MTTESTHGDSTDSPVEERPAVDWLVRVAWLPALLVAVAIGITAAIDFTNAVPRPNRILSNTAGVKALDGHADDYVEGLAKRGIATIPGVHPDRRLSSRGGPDPLMR